MPETRSTCPYCGVGCGVLIEHDGPQITGVRGDPDHPANRGRLCSKGSTLHFTARPATARATRLLHPMGRADRQAPLAAMPWNAALDLAAHRIADVVQRHGADALGVYVSGQLLTEDYHVFNKLVKGVLGCNQIDTNSRLCMSSAVAGYKLTLGADAPPACYEDLDTARTVFIAGSNTAWAHPILFRRIEDAKAARPDLRLIVADPRRTDTAASADLHLALKPGTDVALFHGLLHIICWEGWVDHAYIAAHTEGFDALKDAIRPWTPAETARVCGLAERDLYTAARWIAGVDGATASDPRVFKGADGRLRQPTLSLYCQGLNQSSSGTAKNVALIHLHLATGQIGPPGTGPFSLTGQPNAMGGREVGGLAQLLPGHRDVANPAHRQDIERLWGLDRLGRRLSATPGRSAVEMFQAAADGEVKLLWIACTNPAQSLPDQRTVRRALERAEFVIVQEAFGHTATTPFADLLLPATTWGEKDGTVTNSERRISRVRAAMPPPTHPLHPADGPRHDWAIAQEVAHRLELRLHPGQASLFTFDTPESIWNEHRASTAGRDLDITGLSYALLDHAPRQWPLPSGQLDGTPRLYTNGRFATDSGRARFQAVAYRPVAEACDAAHPFALTTGRLRDQWHGMSRTGLLGRLFGHTPEPRLQMHPHDMARRLMREGQLVRVGNQRGHVVLPLQASTEPGIGQVFIAMHWGADVLGGRDASGLPLGGVNALTNPARCPQSHQPEFKHAAVRVEPIDLPWTLLALAWLSEEEAALARQRIGARLDRFDFALCVPFGRHEEEGRCGVLFRAASAQAPCAEVLEEIRAWLGLDTPHTLRYDDPQRGVHRALRLRRTGPEGAAQLEAFMLTGDTQAEAWITTLLQQEQPVTGPAHRLLHASATAPQPLASPSPQVCTCLNVSEAAIWAHLKACDPAPPAQTLSHLQATLRCGTQCGSCVPNLRRMVAAMPAPSAVAP